MKHIVIAAAGCLLAASAWSQSNQGAPVEVATAELREMTPTMQVAGTVLSRSDAVLSAEVEGRLVDVADVGTRVAAGEPVARIEDTALRLRLAELQAEIERGQARLKFLEAELGRVRRLAETNLAAASQIDQTRSERDVARSDLAVARARLAQLEDQIGRTRVSAPFPGVVVERLARAGERVGVGERIVRLVDPERLEIVARAPLRYYRYVQPGDRLSVSAGGETFETALRTVVSVGNEDLHVFELRLDLEAAGDRRLTVGQTARVSIPTADLREVLAVPRDALVLRGDGTTVYVVDESGSARRAQVATGIGQGDWVEVAGPIRAGDRVVVRGNERLRDGQPVTIQGS
jgi:RND family efflux transporter MFP subunit